MSISRDPPHHWGGDSISPSLIHGPGDSHCHWGRWDYTLKHTLTWVTYTEWNVRRREDDHPDPRHLIGRYQDLDQSDAYDPGRCGSESPVIKVNDLGLMSRPLQPKIILMHRLYSLPPIVVNKNNEGLHPLVTRRSCDVESTSLTLIQRRNKGVCTVGRLSIMYLAVITL